MMLNWIKFITAFLLVLASVITMTVYFNANKPFTSAKTNAIDKAFQSGQLVAAEYAQPYNGTQTLVTVFGEDTEGEQIALFVDETTEGDFESVKLSDGITADHAVKTVREEQDVFKLLHVTLGLEEVGAVWEVAFQNEDGKLNYVYVLFESGQWWKRILNL